MENTMLVGCAELSQNTVCKVVYHPQTDSVQLSLGAIAIVLNADSFVLMHEVLRKATAKIVMQTCAKESV